MRISIIIVGIFTYDKHILDEIKRCYLLDKNVDIFIYNNNTIENNNKIVEYFNNNNINVIISKTILNSNINMNIPINNKIINNWNNFKQKCIDNNIVGGNYSIHIPFSNESFIQPQILSSHQYKQISFALNEIIKYENDNNFKYDYIMKIRLDFYLKNNYFSPYHYFNDKNDILCKSYNNLKFLYDQIDEDDEYHNREFRINNYLYWRTPKYLGGQFILNKDSYDQVSNYLNDRSKFNEIIKDKFVITINDACFFSSGDNFKKFMNNLINNYGQFYHDNSYFWWTAESQLVLSILNSKLYYFDYLQNDNYYKGIEMWFNNLHGIEKYDHNEMKTI